MPAAKAPETAIILVHGECADGLTSAGLLLRSYPTARYIATHPSELAGVLERAATQPLPDRIVLADLSPQASETERMAGIVESLLQKTKITWIDHHAPQWPADFEKRMKRAGVEVVLDRTQTESGASLAARWTKEKDPAMLRVADLIRKRDAWVDPRNPDAMAWTLVAVERDADYVARLREGNLDGLEAAGRELFRAHKGEVDAAVARIKRHSPEVAWLWGQEDISDVAHEIFTKEPRVVFLFRFSPDGRVSVRCKKPLAAKLSQSFGGGGHDRAAGFTFRMSSVRRLRFRFRKGKDRVARDAMVRAQAMVA